MSGLYNAVFGVSDQMQPTMMLLLERQDFQPGRLRDAWFERDGETIVARVHTRNGGGNRPDHEAEIQSMRDHPWYLRDEDDSFDSTYADFYFRVDLQFVRELLVRQRAEAEQVLGAETMAQLPDNDQLLQAFVMTAKDPVDNAARWAEAIGRIAADPSELERVTGELSKHVRVVDGSGAEVPFDGTLLVGDAD